MDGYLLDESHRPTGVNLDQNSGFSERELEDKVSYIFTVKQRMFQKKPYISSDLESNGELSQLTTPGNMSLDPHSRQDV